MNEIAHYQLEHAIEVQVSRTFAWNWRTDVRNWDDPPAQFRLDGPFVAGTWGTTLLPGQEPLRWQIREVRPEQSFVLEMPLDEGAEAHALHAAGNHQSDRRHVRRLS